MRFSSKHSLYLQRGSIMLAAFGLGGGQGASYSVQGVGSYTSSENDGETVNSEIQFDVDGGIRRRTETENLTLFYTDYDPGWSSLEPDETDSASWHVKITFDSGTDLRSGGMANDTWTQLSTAPVMLFASTAGGEDTRAGVYTVSLSDDGGSTTHDSKQITITHFTLAP